MLFRGQQSIIAVSNAETLPSQIQRTQYDGTNHGIQSRSITAASVDGNSFDGHFPSSSKDHVA
jgi:hypothetical protein